MTRPDFDDLAAVEASHWWFVGMRAIAATLLSAHLPQASPLKILDAGCGAGFMLTWLRRYSDGDAVYGTDYSMDALHHCHAQCNKRLTQASVTHLPYANSSFDLVTCFDVLPQLNHPEEDTRALCELRRVLRPQGVLLLRVPAYLWMRSRHDEHMQAKYRYLRAELHGQVTGVGFEVLRATYALSILFPVIAAYRRLRELLRNAPDSDVKPLPAHLGWLNRWLALTLECEAWFLRRTGNRLPFGLSICCVAKPLKSP